MNEKKAHKIDEILSDKPLDWPEDKGDKPEPEVKAAEKPEAPKEEPKATQDAGEKPVEAPKEEPKAPSPDAEPSEAKALRAELDRVRRAKREAEQRLEELSKKPAETPPFWENPEAALAQYQQQQQAALIQERINMTDAVLASVKPDYVAIRDFVIAKAQDNPDPMLVGMVQQAFRSTNPALAVYELGKKLKALEDFGDPDAFRAKTRADIEAEVRRELEAKYQPKTVPPPAAPPPSLAATHGTSPREEVFQPPSTKQIFDR